MTMISEYRTDRRKKRGFVKKKIDFEEDPEK